MELPLHIQDGALFYKDRLGLTETSAAAVCRGLMENARTHGGVLTVLWHDRSPAPERCWGEFYEHLIGELKAENAWFASAGETVRWFKARRAVKFERTETGSGVLVRGAGVGKPVSPPFTVKFYHGVSETTFKPSLSRSSLPVRTVAWTGEGTLESENCPGDLTDAVSRGSTPVAA